MLMQAQNGDAGKAATHSQLALEVGGWSTPVLATLPPSKDPVPIVQQSGWALGLV